MESAESLPTFSAQQKNLNKVITAGEVRQATLKFNNSRDAGPAGLSAEFVKYAPVKVHAVFIQELLNNVFEYHQMLDIGRRSLCPLYKPGKPTGLVFFLTMLRKCPVQSIILLKSVKQKYITYLNLRVQADQIVIEVTLHRQHVYDVIRYKN